MVLALLGMCNWIYKWYQQESADRDTVDEIAAEFALIVETGFRPTGARTGAWPRYPTSTRRWNRPPSRWNGCVPSSNDSSLH